MHVHALPVFGLGANCQVLGRMSRLATRITYHWHTSRKADSYHFQAHVLYLYEVPIGLLQM
jgi:hypothetical protein